MKRILYVLIVVILLSSCKKEKLFSCLDGTWTGTIGQPDDVFTVKDGTIFLPHSGNLTIDKNSNVYNGGTKVATIECNGSTFVFHSTSGSDIICTKVN